MPRFVLMSLLGCVALGTPALAQSDGEQPPMGFFIAKSDHGTGDLGGLAGADQLCQQLAASAGAGERTWRAYLSTQATDDQPAVNARDRIGAGPWHSADGALVAADVYALHGDFERDRNNVHKGTALDATGAAVNGRGDSPNEHDILTGSDSHGMAWATDEDRTCGNWTSASPESRGWVGHHDRQGGGNTSWNSVHSTRGGCHAEGLRSTGGAGHFYCFAAD